MNRTNRQRKNPWCLRNLVLSSPSRQANLNSTLNLVLINRKKASGFKKMDSQVELESAVKAVF